MKLTRLQWFEAGHGTLAVELGIISPDVFMKWVRYRVYLDFKAQGHDHPTAMELTAERNKCDACTVWRDISFFLGKEQRRTLMTSEQISTIRSKAARKKWRRIKSAKLQNGAKIAC